MTISEQRPAAIEKPAFSARALYVGERIDLRSFVKSSRVIAQQPATVAIDGGGIGVLYRYGAAVFFDVAPAAQERFLATLRPLVEQPYPRPESEEVSICVTAEKREGTEAGTTVILHDASIERLQIVAAALGKSVAVGLMLGMFSAMFVGLFLFARHGAAARKMAIPFGPFLALGSVIALFAGERLLDAYLGVFN